MDLRLILQTALLGEVSGALRGVTYGVADREVRVQFWYDGPVSDEDRESAACVVTELIAALPEDWRAMEEVMRLDTPASLPADLPLVFRRREQAGLVPQTAPPSAENRGAPAREAT